MNKDNKVIDKIKNVFLKLYDEETIEYIEDEEIVPKCSINLFEYIKNKLKFNNKTKNENELSRKKYINKEQAIHIANMDKNLKRSMYNDAIDNGYNYGIIELNNFYTTLVKYNNNLYWYIKVIDGKYGYKDYDKNKKGYFDEYSNIRCLVNALSGEYIYIGNKFDTSNIRMITDEEFLRIIFEIKG